MDHRPTTALALVLACAATACGRLREAESRALEGLERAALGLVRENRRIATEAGRLRLELESLKGRARRRAPAGAGAPVAADAPIRIGAHSWTPEQMAAVAERAAREGDHGKAARFFGRLVEERPSHGLIDDLLLYQAGAALLEAGRRRGAVRLFDRLLRERPESEFALSAKIWRGLAHLEGGDRARFAGVVEEFRRKYRNTREWGVLKPHQDRFRPGGRGHAP